MHDHSVWPEDSKKRNGTYETYETEQTSKPTARKKGIFYVYEICIKGCRMYHPSEVAHVRSIICQTLDLFDQEMRL